PVLPDLLKERLEGGPQTFLQAALAGAIRPANPLDDGGCDRIEGRKEALLLVSELLVEGPPRHARETDDLPDARCLVAVRGDRLHHRSVQPGALIADDLRVVEAMGTAGEAFIQRGGRDGRSRARLA